MSDGPRDPRALAVLLGIGGTWGASFLFIKVAVDKVAVDGISPLELVAARLFLGAVTVGLIMRLRRMAVSSCEKQSYAAIVEARERKREISASQWPSVLGVRSEQKAVNTMKPLWAAVGGLVLVGTAGAVAVALPQGEEEAVQEVATATSAEARATPDPLYEGLEKIIEEQKKPPFIGDKLGIFIVGTPDQEVDVPPQYVTADEVCPNGTSLAPWDQAGELALSVDLPPEYTFLPYNPDTGVFGCNGVVSSAKRVYERVYERGGGGFILIGRTRSTVIETIHWPADRVKVTTMGGRQAVLLEPVHPEGSEHGGTDTEIHFPEPFGRTYIRTADLTLAETLRLGEIVAEATKQP